MRRCAADREGGEERGRVQIAKEKLEHWRFGGERGGGPGFKGTFNLIQKMTVLY
jgi:hypothetical protein